MTTPTPDDAPRTATPDPSQRPYRVMTVCTGNICRSPMAEIVLRDRFEAAGLGGRVVVDSTGISSEEHGNPVDRRARRILAEHGYGTGEGHHARQVRPSDVVSRDLVLPMTSQHARALRRLATNTWGLVLVFVVGIGFVAYGIFCLATFTHRRLQAP